jgi:hypothetical protein
LFCGRNCAQLRAFTRAAHSARVRKPRLRKPRLRLNTKAAFTKAVFYARLLPGRVYGSRVYEIRVYGTRVYRTRVCGSAQKPSLRLSTKAARQKCQASETRVTRVYGTRIIARYRTRFTTRYRGAPTGRTGYALCPGGEKMKIPPLESQSTGPSARVLTGKRQTLET